MAPRDAVTIEPTGWHRSYGGAMHERRTLAGLRVLVTGATGFIGGRLTERLLREGCDLYATARSVPVQQVAGVEWIQADVGDPSAAHDLFEAAHPDVAFHLAARVAGSRGLDLVHETLSANLIGTVNVLVAAREAGCKRVVLTGSMEEPAYNSMEAPSSPYAASKWAASGYARMFTDLFGLSVTTLRLFMVYGPGQRDVTKLIPYTILSLLRGTSPELTSGSRPVDWIYVDDVVDALVLAATAGGAEGATVDIGSGSALTIREIVERLVELIDPRSAPAFGSLPDRPLETTRVADLGPARRILGWQPTTGLDAGLRLTVDWFANRTAD
jgi:UDP-glucose 4-epimerase